MNITERLRTRVRAAARTARDRYRNRTGKGPRAIYVGILDGERLWLALATDAGEPALRNPATGEIVRPPNDLPDSHADSEPECRSVRWLLDTVLPAEDGSELEVVALPLDGGPPAVVRTADRPANSARTRSAADGQWRFTLERAELGALHVRRTRAPLVTHVLDAAFIDRSAAITCDALGLESAELLLLDQDGQTVGRLPMARTTLGFERVVTDADVPPRPMAYRVVFGTPDDHVPMARRSNDLHIVDPVAAVMPLILAGDSDYVGARVRFAPDGTLRVVRLDPSLQEQA